MCKDHKIIIIYLEKKYCKKIKLAKDLIILKRFKKNLC